MEFGPVPVAEAEGAILAHSLVLTVGKLGKGHVLDAADVAALVAHGCDRVTVARLGPEDIGEDFAALSVAQALVPDALAAGLELTVPHAGRVNLRAARVGLIGMNRAVLDALNMADSAITLATLPPLARVAAGDLVGTVKIITYGVQRAALARALIGVAGAIRVMPVVLQRAGLILTEVPGPELKLIAKGRRVVAARLAGLGIDLVDVRVVAHDGRAISEALGSIGGDIVLMLTGAATSDPYDVAPSALRAAGGVVLRFGMPVDPGNLLFHGYLGARRVVGLPGCARSPALNGADWVLERLACGLEVTDTDIAAMGVGGLLKEIPQRGRLREG